MPAFPDALTSCMCWSHSSSADMSAPPWGVDMTPPPDLSLLCKSGIGSDKEDTPPSRLLSVSSGYREPPPAPLKPREDPEDSGPEAEMLLQFWLSSS